MSKTVTFSHDEIGALLAVVRACDPDEFNEPEARAVIYKARTLRPNDDIYVPRRKP